MDGIEKFLLEMIRPWAVPFFAGMGYMVWKHRDKFFGVEKAQPEGRRREDALIRELTDKMEESNECHRTIAKNLKENGEKIDELKLDVVHELKTFTREMKESAEMIHRRIDDLYVKGK